MRNSLAVLQGGSCKEICRTRQYPKSQVKSISNLHLTHNLCNSCNRFIPKNECIRNKCPCCNKQVVIRAYVLPLSKFLGPTQASLIEFISRHHDGVTPKFVECQLRLSKNVVNQGLCRLLKAGFVYRAKRFKLAYDPHHWRTLYKLTNAGEQYATGITMILSAMSTAKQFPGVTSTSHT